MVSLSPLDLVGQGKRASLPCLFVVMSYRLFPTSFLHLSAKFDDLSTKHFLDPGAYYLTTSKPRIPKPSFSFRT
jgi:hypothetical protein